MPQGVWTSMPGRDPLEVPLPSYAPLSPQVIKDHEKLFDVRINDGWQPGRMGPIIEEDRNDKARARGERHLFSDEVRQAKHLIKQAYTPTKTEVRMKGYDEVEWHKYPVNPDVDEEVPIEPSKPIMVKPAGSRLPYDNSFLSGWLEDGPKMRGLRAAKNGEGGSQAKRGRRPSTAELVAKPRLSTRKMMNNFFQKLHGDGPQVKTMDDIVAEVIGAANANKEQGKPGGGSEAGAGKGKLVRRRSVEKVLAYVRVASNRERSPSPGPSKPMMARILEYVQSRIGGDAGPGSKAPEPFLVGEVCNALRASLPIVSEVLLACERLHYLRIQNPHPPRPGGRKTRTVLASSMVIIMPHVDPAYWDMADIAKARDINRDIEQRERARRQKSQDDEGRPRGRRASTAGPPPARRVDTRR